MKKTLNNSETSCVYVIRDDDEYLLNEENKIKERWKNYFESVFACKDTVADDKLTAIVCMIDDGNENEITMDEVMKELKLMKVGKAVGYDGGSSEMLRGDGGIVASLLYQLFNKYWKAIGYLTTDVKQSLYLSIKGKVHGVFVQITAL
ncbi:hypothetical protein EVAR_4328_1 [Eumeta japonica]|uniref:Uncharacterized protein n=1 Tax=Eumeta variegata TaxID=151549 RepID=A0A4C1VE03_EUMVA|nr:hypothetical protein EVAR_4328_1 [Eumeta japonica]